jgi:hypothetical protein
MYCLIKLAMMILILVLMGCKICGLLLSLKYSPPKNKKIFGGAVLYKSTIIKGTGFGKESTNP